MPRQIALLGDTAKAPEVEAALRDAGLKAVRIADLLQVPDSVDTVSGMPLVITSAEALICALQQSDGETALQDIECLVHGDAGHREVLASVSAVDHAVFLSRPVDRRFLTELLKDYRDDITSPADSEHGSAPDIALDGFGKLYGSSPPMHRLYRLLRKAAASDASLCLYGESGTGKELAAQTVHSFSSRSRHPFLAVNCSAIPADLFESEFFGHEKGSFSGAHRQTSGLFQRVGEGTLLLDEITEMDPDLQAKLLRVLETGKYRRIGGTQNLEVTARVLTATNRRPADAIQSGRLREDLYYRISQLEIHLPPLRERGDDIVQLARLFAHRFSIESGRQSILRPDTEAVLAHYHWPGNVRQLWNVVQVACTTGNHEISPADLPDLEEGDAAEPALGERVTLPVGVSLKEAERRLIEATMAKFEDDKPRVAQALGISLRTLYTRLKSYEDLRDR